MNSKNTKKLKTSEESPEYRGKPMKKLPLNVCVQPSHVELASPIQLKEPCNDDRIG